MTIIYSKDGTKKVDIDTSTLLGDVARDRKIYRQGDNAQLWRSKNGTYFKGMCLDHAQKRGGIVNCYNFIPLTDIEAKNWVIYYYGPSELENFGFSDDATMI